jgi:hypothetical protein
MVNIDPISHTWFRELGNHHNHNNNDDNNLYIYIRRPLHDTPPSFPAEQRPTTSFPANDERETPRHATQLSSRAASYHQLSSRR